MYTLFVGALAQTLFILADGELLSIDSTGKTLGTISDKLFFVEAEAFAQSQPYQSTLMVSRTATLYSWNRSDFVALDHTIPVQIRKQKKVFSKVTQPEEIYGFCTLKSFRAGEFVAQKPFKNDSMHIVVDGAVEIVGGNRIVKEQGYFGEEYIINPSRFKRWTVTAIAKTDCTILLFSFKGYKHPSFVECRKVIDERYLLLQNANDPRRKTMMALLGAANEVVVNSPKSTNSKPETTVKERQAHAVETDTLTEKTEKRKKRKSRSKSGKSDALDDDSSAAGFFGFSILGPLRKDLDADTADTVVKWNMICL